MLTFKVPPFVEVRIAETDEEKSLLRHQAVFLKPGTGGAPRHEIDRVAVTWRNQVSLNSVLEPLDQFTELPGNNSLSLPAVQKAVEISIETGGPKVSQEDTFYLVHPGPLARTAAGIRNQLATARMSENRDREINGVLVQQNRPITYWLPITIKGTEVRVELAFCQLALAPTFSDSAWLIVPHNKENPNAIWYMPADQPAVYLEATYATSQTQEVEQRAFAALKSKAYELGIVVEDAKHEPDGTGEFPDYKATLDGQPWVIEITRILGKIPQTRVVAVRAKSEYAALCRAAGQTSIVSRDIDEAIKKAIEEKAQKASQVSINDKYCLLLVDVMELIDRQNIAQWEKYNLEVFDSVILVHITPDQPDKITLIKGSMLHS